ncbi:hypothetical protein VFPPC_11843 [Pochonia chlamydosporia 170]|uniref:Uncharacterized protein n=1 Tax=Pochonia chlamydosporia 170 TaxID=1380566 RepID=A0A179EXT0_METCM|nr:hypothetical protein VFPPC_11843 [Pochonia chlamydosporia 170]OAQ57952.1 hypothetical protein VFPPC_11843 [Pochonia chlamydosporia 170]
MEEPVTELRELLGGLSVAQFARLPQEQRSTIYRHHLVRNDIIVNEAEDFDQSNLRIASGTIFRQQRFMDNDETGKQLVKEANEIYYAENIFLVRLHWLCEFMSERFGDEETNVPIAPLVGGIIVEVDLHDDKHERLSYEVDSSDSEDEGKDVADQGDGGRLATWTVNRLRDLFLFTNATSITVRLRGGGMRDDSDLATHQTIKDIAQIVRELIGHFGSRFDIGKMLDSGHQPYQSLREYWTPPTQLAMRNVRNFNASLKDIMQIEIEEWTCK